MANLCLGYVYSYDRCEGRYWRDQMTPETEEEEKQEQDPNIGYWNFYGAVPESEEELTAGPMGARGWLRFAAAVILIGCLVAGLAGNGWSWTFNWSSSSSIWI